MPAKLEYFKRAKPARAYYSDEASALEALRPGQVVVLREGSSATFEGLETSPSGQRVAAVVLPDGISFVNPNVNLEFTTDALTAADWWIQAAEKLAPQGATALTLRSPIGGLTRAGKLLRSIDAAQEERDPEKKKTLAASALREARSYAGKPAPIATAPPLPAGPDKAPQKPSPSSEKPEGSTPWGLIAGGILLGLALLGGAASNNDDGEED